MNLDINEIKSTVIKELPHLIFCFLRWVIFHIVVFVYHIALPTWYIIFRLSRTSFSIGKTGYKYLKMVTAKS